MRAAGVLGVLVLAAALVGMAAGYQASSSAAEFGVPPPEEMHCSGGLCHPVDLEMRELGDGVDAEVLMRLVEAGMATTPELNGPTTYFGARRPRSNNAPDADFLTKARSADMPLDVRLFELVPPAGGRGTPNYHVATELRCPVREVKRVGKYAELTVKEVVERETCPEEAEVTRPRPPPDADVYVVCHGFRNSFVAGGTMQPVAPNQTPPLDESTDWVRSLTAALYKRARASGRNVVVYAVDWHSTGLYYCDIVERQFAAVALNIVRSLRSLGVSPERVTWVGHSLGAQMSGLVAHEWRQIVAKESQPRNTPLGSKIKRIVAFDPAGPPYTDTYCMESDWTSYSRAWRLDQTDASHVVVLHTNFDSEDTMLHLGDPARLGHQDIFFVYPDMFKESPGNESPGNGFLNVALHGLGQRVFERMLCGEPSNDVGAPCASDWAIRVTPRSLSSPPKFLTAAFLDCDPVQTPECIDWRGNAIFFPFLAPPAPEKLFTQNGLVRPHSSSMLVAELTAFCAQSSVPMPCVSYPRGPEWCKENEWEWLESIRKNMCKRSRLFGAKPEVPYNLLHQRFYTLLGQHLPQAVAGGVRETLLITALQTLLVAKFEQAVPLGERRAPAVGPVTADLSYRVVGLERTEAESTGELAQQVLVVPWKALLERKGTYKVLPPNTQQADEVESALEKEEEEKTKQEEADDASDEVAEQSAEAQSDAMLEQQMEQAQQQQQQDEAQQQQGQQAQGQQQGQQAQGQQQDASAAGTSGDSKEEATSGNAAATQETGAAATQETGAAATQETGAAATTQETGAATTTQETRAATAQGAAATSESTATGTADTTVGTAATGTADTTAGTAATADTTAGTAAAGAAGSQTTEQAATAPAPAARVVSTEDPFKLAEAMDSDPAVCQSSWLALPLNERIAVVDELLDGWTDDDDEQALLSFARCESQDCDSMKALFNARGEGIESDVDHGNWVEMKKIAAQCGIMFE